MQKLFIGNLECYKGSVSVSCLSSYSATVFHKAISSQLTTFGFYEEFLLVYYGFSKEGGYSHFTGGENCCLDVNT